ncbi:unnamed protein product [Chironomus riparius]|uniref:Uncharacterized protein n=1 Tax=Chironomus riparius TaxID=315576 RepID=A0A9N9RQ50_9DIPT|nr:unnamed protein product [Chironomus riparius]
MSLIQLLVILLSLHIAHAAPTEITLHNKDSVTNSSAVRNWTLFCEDLCSLKISGPACGLDCHKIPVNKDLVAMADIITAEDHEELCEDLCENGLGDNRCECKVPIIPAHFIPAIHRPDKFKICADACRFYRVTLKGCSRCPFEESEEQTFSRFHLPPPPPHPPVLSPQMPVLQNFRPNPQSAMQAPMQLPQTTPDSTTPDWNRLCAQLCRNGTGGLLCNCDLPPFK